MLNQLAPSEREQLLRLAIASKFKRESTRLSPITKHAVRGGPVPLSYGQQRLWFLEQVEPGKASYSVPVVLRLTGNLDELALERALAGVVERHEVLRTRFVLGADEETPFQQIDPPGGVLLQRIDMTNAADDADADTVDRWIAEEAKQPFDLAHGPLLRASLVQLAADQFRLCLTMHHSIVDGWSVGILLRELGELYAAHHEDRLSTLPPLPVHYADFSVWQRQWLAGEVYERQRQYWTEKLHGLEPLELPTDFARPPMQSSRGATERFIIPAGLKQKLVRLSQSEGATLFITLLTGFQVLLARYSGSSDIAVGTSVANRQRAEVEDLIGFFVNALVLRTGVRAEMTFRQLLKSVRTTCLEAYAHQDMPFEKLVQELHPVRDLSRSPLFQVMFVFQNDEEAKWDSVWEACGLKAALKYAETGNIKFDLHLTMGESGDELDGALDYSTDLFTTTKAKKLLAHFIVLLERLATSPDTALSEFTLLTQDEDQQIRTWNQTALPYQTRGTLVSLFEEQVKRSPRTTALISGAGRLSYLELNHRANQLARHLVKLGVTAETVVGIYLERSNNAVIVMLAVLKAGGAYLPLDPAYPRDRLEYMIDEARVEFIVTRGELSARPLSTRPKHICLDKDRLPISSGNPANLNVQISSDQVAYVIFTSGSTGRPKGLLGRHQSTINRLSWMHAKYPYATGEVCCARTSLNFVDSVSELFGPLLKGISIVLLSPELILDLPQLTHALATHSITRMLVVPSFLQVLLEAHDSGQITLPRLKYWVTSGESISSVNANQLLAHDSATRLINLYGSSEVAGDVTWHEMSLPTDHAYVPIGRPISNTEVHILDRHLQRVPVGLDGEIFIGGANLARGYLNHFDLTAQRFWPNPFASQPGSRMYRTGDIGRYLPDGSIVLQGRKDHQVKIRGHRVEPGEIEAVILQHPDVRQAVVIPRINADGHTNIFAYFVAANESASLATELRSLLKRTLPSYMVPISFTELAAMPMTTSLKIDRGALPEAAVTHSSLSLESEPHTDLEKDIHDVWKKLLLVDRVGLDDNFFDIGGHSLQLVRLRNRLRKATGQDVSVLDLFTHTTIRGLVTLLSERGGSSVLRRLANGGRHNG